MIKEHDVVALTKDVAECGLVRGDTGAIVHVYPDGLAVEVEFTTVQGKTIAIETLPIDAVRPIGPRDMAHVREIANAAE